jgi:hypothetical protein
MNRFSTMLPVIVVLVLLVALVATDVATENDR